MFVTLFRHAERENTGTENPGLTKKGVDQSHNLATLIANNSLPQPERILASPRTRAQQTMEPLARKHSILIEVLPGLDERQSSESSTQFEERVVKFLATIPDYRAHLFLCSHLDWIEEALLRIPCDADLLQSQFQIWQPGQFLHFEIRDGLWQIRKKGVI